ncbi:hypothetical protein DESUT3_08330 [Desulfuromonas versatilis]|uniref:DUF444 family protein n=1 Tax=Desulfuromonas versatilis TaxID=2802975 RepID=A0ABN6DV69_9BACT|nr:DUF444 family protein [Desulfuromonas versatilis]BCR03764.1 hypothetical protein DESUT3_08330 [Desulfuromonas versatilis]
MNPKLARYFAEIKKRGLSPQREALIRAELALGGGHGLREVVGREEFATSALGLYADGDLSRIQAMTSPQGSYTTNVRSLDELLERDRQREKDGFPRKIRVGRLIKPGKGDSGKVVVVPTTVEEKFLHDSAFKQEQEGGGASGGTGEGEEGEVIGEQPVRGPGEAGSGSAGQGEGGGHEVESNAYDLGRILTEKFELPNLKEKGKKRSLSRYTYELTDKNRGFGQVLDKKATLRKILETNISLGNLPDLGEIDTTRFLISPDDKVYRILSREKDYESQAMVFFVRDYSGSMEGKATELVVSQHVMIYSWLLYQYEKNVESRFIVHDTDATEVPDFYTYYNSRVAGGTRVAAAYRLVNEIVDKENLVQDYNIYIFHGTDGDDWDTGGKEVLPELKAMLRYANRVGVTIAEHISGPSHSTEVERYLKSSGLIEQASNLLRLDVMGEDADEKRVIEGIKSLIS